MPSPIADIISATSACATDGTGGIITVRARPGIDGQIHDEPENVTVSIKDAAGNIVATGNRIGASIFTFVFRGISDGDYDVFASDHIPSTSSPEPVTVQCGAIQNPYKIEIDESLKVITKPAPRGTATGSALLAVKSLAVPGGFSTGPAGGAAVYVHLGDFNWQFCNPYDAATIVTHRAIVFTQKRAGSYTAYFKVLDTSSTERFTLNYDFAIPEEVVYGCTNPLATNYNPAATDDDGTCELPVAVPPKPRFSIPLLNSLRYVVLAPGAMPNFNNRTYCAEQWPGIFKVPYYQKVGRYDALVTQFKSNYPTHVVEVTNYVSGQFITQIPVVKIRQNRGRERQYPAWLTAHAADATKSRLYFNGGALPFDFVAGDAVTLRNALLSAANGLKQVVSVSFDAVDSIPYLVLNYAYPTTDSRISLDAVTQYDLQPYDVFQFAATWGNIPNGVYLFTLRASGPDMPTVEAVSEPVAMFTEHPGTHLITWRNYEDARGLIFSQGLICGLRVESDLWARTPTGTRSTMRLPNGRLLKLASTSQRRAELVTKRLPPYMHEKLSFVFGLDHVEINGVQYETDETYAVDLNKRAALSNGSITVEEVGEDVENGTDLGDNTPAGTGFIIVNNNRLKA